jgi:Domain of unknown function (DUF6046)
VILPWQITKMSLINVTIPNVGGLAKAVAMSTIVGKTFPNGKPIPVVQETIDIRGGVDNYLGVAALTELGFQINDKEYYLNDCIMTVSQERNIVETALQGRDGTVKQFISDGDFSISVQAAISADSLLSNNNRYDITDEYPIDDLKDFIKNVLKAKEAIAVTSDWLDLWNIRTVVIKSYNFEQEVYSNRQTFTMQMLSDEPFEIKLLQ